MNIDSIKTWLDEQASGDIRVWILAVAVCMVMIYLVIGVIFGGYGGHRFEMISKLKFLENSPHNYYASQDELDKARDAWKARAEAQANGKRLPIDPIMERYEAMPKSVYSEAKSGVVLYSHDYQRLNESQQIPRQSGERLVATGESGRSGAAVNSNGERQVADSDDDIQRYNTSSDNQQNNTVASTEPKKAFTFDEPSFRTKPVTHAFDVELVGEASQCTQMVRDGSTADILFRQGSAAIKGVSLNRLDTLIEMQRVCPGTVFEVAENPAGRADVADRKSLIQRRRDEIKYYMLHRSVPKEIILMKENS